MKKLSIEEKAKRFDEVLAMAKDCINYIPDDSINQYMLDMFPELKEKESDDEKIRKVLISRFNESGELDGISYDNIRIWLEKQGEQKPADKVEPKFKVGDWVTNNIETVQIIDYDIDYGYQVNYKGNLQHRDTDIIKKEYHLWTILDAKDGDVLVDSKKNIILMFRAIGNIKWDGVIDYHCYYYCYQEDFIVHKDSDYWGSAENTQLKPATNGQCGLLLSKMKEAGYEWDAEKKELKKIDARKNLVLDEDLMQADCMMIEPESSWSEDDEKYHRSICCYLNEFGNLISIKNEEKSLSIYKACDWLKSLKDRIQQPK